MYKSVRSVEAALSSAEHNFLSSLCCCIHSLSIPGILHNPKRATRVAELRPAILSSDRHSIMASKAVYYCSFLKSQNAGPTNIAVNDPSNSRFHFLQFCFSVSVVGLTPYRKQPLFLNTPLLKNRKR